MKLFTNPNENMYLRRWINVIPQIILPGGAYYFAGRYKLTIICFSVIFLMHLFTGWLILSPRIDNYNYIYLTYFVIIMAWSIFLFHSCTKKIPKKRLLKKTIIFFAIIIILYAFNFTVALGIRATYLHLFKVSSDSMAPTIIENDKVIANKMAYNKKKPQRGEIVVFHPPVEEKQFFVFRIC